MIPSLSGQQRDRLAVGGRAGDPDPELSGGMERDPDLDKARLGLAEQLSKVAVSTSLSTSTSPTSSGSPAMPRPW